MEVPPLVVEAEEKSPAIVVTDRMLSTSFGSPFMIQTKKRGNVGKPKDRGAAGDPRAAMRREMPFLKNSPVEGSDQ
jgi:hypothetical protein